MEAVISVDVRSDGPSTFDVWISHEGSSGFHYSGLTAAQVGEQVSDYIDCVEKGYENRDYIYL